jgi:hypothetical protein
MNKFSIFTLKALRKIYAKTFSVKSLDRPESIQDAEIASKLIYDKLMSEEPCMIARFGANELATMVNYIGIKNMHHSIFSYIRGEIPEWWWNDWVKKQMHINAGFFPPTSKNFERFCELMLEDMKEVDILGSWLANERYFENKLKNISRIYLPLLEPYYSEKNPWTKALENKKVLVVHPFAELIEKQYSENRTKLFNNPDILPSFQLQTIKAVQSLGGLSTGFKDWFEALNWMKQEIDSRDYDICLIGCGAYGFPLAAHVKRQGKKAVHLGGTLQLMFGIKGKRWEAPNYGVTQWNIPYDFYTSLMNAYWVRPGEHLKPQNANQVEGACYW